MAARHQNRFRGHTGKFISVLTAALIFFWAFSSEPSTQVQAAEPSSGGTLRHVQVRETGRIVSVRTNNKVQAWLGDRLLVLEAASATFTLIRGRNKLVLQGLELLIGKIVTVWGEFVPPNPHHQRPAIKVASWTEGLTPLAPDPLKRSPPGSSGDSD